MIALPRPSWPIPERFKLATSETQQLTQNQIAGSEQTLNSS